MSVQKFYDDLADAYHLIFADWKASVERQGEILDRLIRTQAGEAGSLLDCSCGIGTQAIGLAARGYHVHATDLSPAAVERARREAERFGVSMTFGVADFRTLAQQVDGVFDVVLTCDNALPHLLTDAELELAARNMRAKLKLGGLLLASIRDYDELLATRPRATMPSVMDEGKRIVFQVWDWADTIYTLHHFILTESGGQWTTTQGETQYRALRREELSHILKIAGFENIRWHMPAETNYHQPIVTAVASK
jgi:glycine/sarcosine N-methyltransferase